MKRRPFLLLCATSLLAGCTSWNPFSSTKAKAPAETKDDQPHTVGDLARPFGMFNVKIEAVGLVAGLHGTGSDPEPSPQRAMLINEMRRRNVQDANNLLATRNFSLVLVRGFLRPGIQKGDPFDVELQITDRSETTSLRGGKLLETRLSDMAIIPGRVLEGRVRGIAQGPVLVDPSATEKFNRVELGRGVVLGGGIALKSRSVGLFLDGAEATNMTPEQLRNAVVKSALVANAVNRRFSTRKHGSKEGVATAIRGNYVDLVVDPAYKDNLVRYFQVLRAIELRETEADVAQRLVKLRTKLLDPVSAAEAAIKLEAIGKPAADVLVAGAASLDPQVRFYSAEALAYLDRREAAEPLARAAYESVAFRAQALTALSVMRDPAAFDKLRDLLAVPSAETRYGAFRALTIACPDDSLVKGENLGEQFSYHVLDTQGPPMIHVTRNRLAEVVLFGLNQRFLTPLVLNAGNQIMITNTPDGEIAVSKFAPHEADQKRVVSCRVDDVIRAIVELGGTYPDVVQALQEAKATKCLEGRFEVDALPESGLSYEPETEESEPLGAPPDEKAETKAE